MGYIYIIKNTVNDKVYIGQTQNDIQHRFKQHIVNSKNPHRNTKICNAIREIGADNFFIELLMETEELNEAEKYYINKYDSYLNGYNGNSGGSIGSLSNKYLIDDIRHLANIGMTRQDICKNMSITQETLSKIVVMENINIESVVDIDLSTSKIDCYSKDLKNVKTFDNIKEAFEYFKKLNFDIKYGNFEYRVKQSCRLGNIAYNCRWRLHGEHFEKNKFVNDMIFNKKENNYTCPVCGNYKNAEANLCIDCYQTQQRSNIPDIQTLQQLLSEYSYEAIGRMYNVTGKAVRKWADLYGLVESRMMDKSGIICVELNKKFDTFKEAAEYLIKNSLTSATNVNALSYRISLAKKNKKIYNGFTWK